MSFKAVGGQNQAKENKVEPLNMEDLDSGPRDKAKKDD